MKNVTNPQHYRGVMIKGVEIQPADIIEAYFPNDGLLSQACKYLLRAGRKPEASYLADVGKALWWAARALLHKGGSIDLPLCKPDMVSIDGKPLLIGPKKRK